jgi:hypothetical protein
MPKRTPRPMEVDPAFAPVVDAFAADPEVRGGRMMASFGLKVNGKIFAMSVRGRFVAKLPRARIDELVAAGRGVRFAPGNGRVMWEWIDMEGGEAEWAALAREAHDFVRAGAA